MNQFKQKGIIIIISLLFLARASISNGLLVSNVTLTSSGTISYSQGSNLSYIIYQSSGVNYIQSVSTGSNVYSSSSVVKTFSTAFGLVSSGGTITVLPATYTAAATVYMEYCTGVTLVFQSGAVLTIGNGVDGTVLNIWYDTNCTFVNLSINGNAQNQVTGSGATSCGVKIYDSSGCFVTGSTITNCAMQGFVANDDVAGDLPNGIVNSTITFCGWNGITLGTGGPDTIGAYAINNTVAYCSDVGITNYGIGDYVVGNFIHDMNGITGGGGNAHWGVGVEDNGYDLISNNIMVNCRIGISIVGTVSTGYPVQSNLVIYNSITNCSTGIVTSDTGYDTITRNQITDWSSGYNFGIREEDGTNNIITSNTLISSGTSAGYGQAAIYSLNTSNSSICDNTVTTQLSADDIGVLIGGGTNGTVIEGNNIQAGTGVYIGSGIYGSSSCNNNRLYQNNLNNCTTPITDSGTNTLLLKPNTSILTINCPSLNGAINPLPGTYLESNSSQVTITLTPDTNYNSVLNVDGVNVTLTDNAYTLSMNRDHIVYTIFSTSE